MRRFITFQITLLSLIIFVIYSPHAAAQLKAKVISLHEVRSVESVKYILDTIIIAYQPLNASFRFQFNDLAGNRGAIDLNETYEIQKGNSGTGLRFEIPGLHSDFMQFQFHPSVVHFPNLFYQDNMQAALIKAQWNNGNSASGLDFRIPESAKDFLQVKNSSKSGEYELYLIPKKIKKTGIIYENVIVSDPITQVTGVLTVSAKVFQSNYKSTIIQSDGKLTLLLENIGEEPLKIFNIQIERNRFRCNPDLALETIIEPKKTLEFSLIPNIKIKGIISRIVKDRIIIITSDFVNPKQILDSIIELPGII